MLLTRPGLFALYLKKRKGLEYIISEHDGIYMPGYDNYHIPGQFEKKMVPVIYKNAKKIHAVSKSLADALVNLKLASKNSGGNSKCCKYKYF